ncbi:peroxin 13 [Histoplasma capsulatum var. duboisii H88]|uniref:Peroxisomal membrane protein PEX13 n=1 Tax=Ajellomyces capsulatus (strain H88) TaxID=544711 RepID=F0UEH8_AJEC8|nr:peroxin 13 [Histoplasma capsulatum var. duboisii H88]QSS55483.1 peroxin 13 [Histoplasma capsulatum var. duboisii H88]
MASASPPKPWERAGASAGAAAAAVSGPLLNTSATTTSTSPATTTSAPDLPSRPSSLNSVVNQTASNYSPYGTSRLGQSPYGGAYGGYNSYTSPYSRLGGMGSMYGGYGAGYGGMYGGMGGMGGYGGMYGGIPPGGDPNSLTNSFSQSTQATFQLIESIVGAFGGFAQMLESTYMATHSSFFAMVSVAEQFGNLRNTLGSVLGIFTVLRWFRTLIAKFTGRPPPADATSLTPSAFAVFTGKGQMPATLPDGSPAPPRPSKKPFFFFLVAVFGLPYLMGKLIRTLARTQELEAKRMMIGPNGEPLPGNQQQNVIDPSKLDFCRVMYDYTPESQNTAGVDLAVKKGDLVAVLSRSDPMGNPSEWWRCRARDGAVGYLPGPYLETIQRKLQQQAIMAGADASESVSAPSTLASSRNNTVLGATGSAADEQLKQRANSLKATYTKPALKGKMGDISPESFQKSTFYS